MHVVHFLVVILSTILFKVVFSLAPAVAQETQPVIPNFWDARIIPDRPASFPDKIQFLATDGFPPFVFRDTEGRLTGFNVDLSRAICIELGSACSIRIKEFDALVPAIMADEGNAIISGLATNKKLNETLYFTPDYLKLPARFVVRRADAETFDENALSDVTISVEAGSRHEAFALKFWPSAAIQSYTTLQGARNAVKTGAAQAHFGDGMALSFWLNSTQPDDCCTFAGGPWLEPGYFDKGLSIAVRKTDVEIADALEYALSVLAQKGTYRELYLRYFPISFY
ncbi:MAG: transporter substrate-binding domain-containing protein [Rhodobacteraceae bacterium]|nr:transporter substrate-binding domain-containing protein [Paracoccaceae bacterium]